MKDIKSYETERLILRPTQEEDAPFVLELLNSPKWLKYIGDRKVYTIADAVKYINEKMKPQQERLGYSNYTVIKKIDGAKMGSCGIYDREGLEGVDIGFAFLSDYERKGYAYEAAQKIMSVGFNEFNIKKIKAITTQENFSSQKLLEKLGLKFVELIKIQNDEEELMLYEILNK